MILLKPECACTDPTVNQRLSVKLGVESVLEKEDDDGAKLHVSVRFQFTRQTKVRQTRFGKEVGVCGPGNNSWHTCSQTVGDK